MSWAGLYRVLAGTCEGGASDENWRISEAARCMPEATGFAWQLNPQLHESNLVAKNKTLGPSR